MTLSLLVLIAETNFNLKSKLKSECCWIYYVAQISISKVLHEIRTHYVTQISLLKILQETRTHHVVQNAASKVFKQVGTGA